MPQPNRHKESLLTHAEAMRLWHYDSATGRLYNRVWRLGHAPGAVAGGPNKRGYWTVLYRHRVFLQHRLIWFVAHGAWPAHNIDHVNGDKADNRLVNLRDVDQSANMFNVQMQKLRAGKSLGVRFKANGWEASIKVRGTERYLGRFQSKDKAQRAYLAAARLARAEIFATPAPAPSAVAAPSLETFVTPRVRLTLTQERLRQLLHYEPETGIFTWRVTRNGRNSRAGMRAGVINKKWGHRNLKVDGKGYGAHRLAFLYMTGLLPSLYVDHKNRNPDDNRWVNLRLADDSQSAANRIFVNMTGLKGVRPNGKNWSASLRCRGVSRYLGTYATPELAHAAYAEAARRFHGEFARTE